jgi:methyl-accepting chemotaxis protein
MTRFSNLSIKTKLTLTVAAIVLFYTAVLVLLTYGLLGEMAERNSIELAETVLEETDKQITRFFEDMEELALSFREYPPVYEVDTPRLKELILATVRSRRSYMRAIYLGTEEGEMYEWGYGKGFVDNEPSFPPDYDPRKRPWYGAAVEANGFAVTDPYLYASIDALGITCVVPVEHPSGENIGVLGFDIMLDDLRSMVAALDISMDGKVLLLDRRGESLVNQFSADEKSLFMSKLRDTAAAADRRSFTVRAGESSHFVSYKENRSSGWKLFIGLPIEEVMTTTNTGIRISMALDLFLMILLLITLEWSGRRMLIEPVEQIASTIGRIQRGEGGARIQLERDDEFGQLARTFNRLADTVEEYTNEMEEKVRERTDRIRRLQQENVRLRIIEEKERIYGYLHDSLGSRLTNIFISNNVARSAAQTDPEVLSDMHDRIEENAQAGLEDLKDILAGSMENHRTIIDSITRMELQIRRRLELKEIDFHFHASSEELGVIDHRTVFDLEKILQELVSNVLKHSGASVVELSLEVREDILRLVFRDDGQGFRIKEVSERSFGIHSLRSRISHRGGDMRIDTRPGEGTEVRIWLPFGEERDDEAD